MQGEVWRETRPMVLAGLVLLAVVGICLLLLQIIQIIAILFLALVVSLALNPTVDTLARYHVPRVLSVLLVYLAVALALGIFSYYALQQIEDATFDLQLSEIKSSYDELRGGTPLPSSDEVTKSLQGLSSGLSTGLVARTVSAITSLFYFVTVLFGAVLFTITQERLRQIVFDFVPPVHRERANGLLTKLAKGIRGYVIGEFVAMLVIGVVTYIGLLLIGSRVPLVLAFIAFLTEILPLVGPWIAFVPAAAIALTDGLWQLVQVSLLYLVVQAIENYLVTPLVHGHESEVPALLILVALLVGSSLMGILGALIALPLAVSLHIIYFELVRPWNRSRLEGDTSTHAAETREPVAKQG